MDSSEDEGLFITQSSTKADISAEIPWFRKTMDLPGCGGTPYIGLYGEAPPERGTFFRHQVYKRVGISQVELYKRVGIGRFTA